MTLIADFVNRFGTREAIQRNGSEQRIFFKGVVLDRVRIVKVLVVGCLAALGVQVLKRRVSWSVMPLQLVIGGITIWQIMTACYRKYVWTSDIIASVRAGVQMLDLTVGQYVYEMFDDLEDEQEARKQSTLLVKHIVLEGKVHENGRELRLWQIARDVTKMDACWEEFFRKHGYDRKMRSQAKSQAKEALFEWFGAVAKYHQELKWFVDIDLHAIENLSIDCPPGMLSELIKTQRRLSCLFYGQQTKTADGSYTIQKMTGEEYS